MIQTLRRLKLHQFKETFHSITLILPSIFRQIERLVIFNKKSKCKFQQALNTSKEFIILNFFQISPMNLRTLGDMKKDTDKDKPKGKHTESYTGGQKSGMAVINPDVQSLMDKAEKNSKTPEEFEKQQKSKDGNVCKITLYQNGFSIDDGEFQDYNDPQNKKFMDELNKGLIPKQLRAKYPKGGLSVSLSDKTKEKYTPPPPPPYVAFSGQGTSLGGSSNTQANKFAKKSKACENFILEPDRTREVTAIRARLLNGQTITLEANLNTSVQDIYNHIATVSGVSNFELAEGFPPKPVNLSLTVEEADLQGATLIQKG